jgi:hypothetical protein
MMDRIPACVSRINTPYVGLKNPHKWGFMSGPEVIQTPVVLSAIEA